MEGEPTPQCAPGAAACELRHDFGELRLEAGERIEDLCQSWTLNNPEELWVNQVGVRAGAAYHHATWVHVPNTLFDRPDGSWPCKEPHFEERQAALRGGWLFVQSPQARTQTLKLSEGAAVRIPPWSRVIGRTHLVNTETSTADANLRLSITAIPRDAVKVKLTPFHFTYNDLRLPPNASAMFTGRCDFKTTFEAVAGGPFSFKIHHVLPHYHELGGLFGVNALDGTRDVRPIYTLVGAMEAGGRTYDPPVDISQQSGLAFTCGYTNPHDREVGWGPSGEMCVMLGFAESSMVFETEVAEGAGAVVGVEEEVVLHEGVCSVTGSPASQEQPGGAPPAK